MQIIIYIAMAKIISNFKYILILIAVGLVSGFSTFAILSLPHTYRDITNVLILPLALSAILILVSFLVTRKLKQNIKKLAKLLGIIFVMAYIMLESIFIILTFQTIETLIFLIPIDLVLMSIPLFSLFNGGKKQIGLEFNSDLTLRLQSFVGTNAPEVYTKESIGGIFGGSTNGEPWKIIIYKHAMENLNDDELDMLMLEIYYKKLLKTGRKTIFFAFSFTTFLFDAYLATFVMDMKFPPAYSPYFIGMQIGLLIVTFSLPFMINRLAMKGNIPVDREILSHNGNRMALISLIYKENSHEPGIMMTQRQYNRLKAKQARNAKMRIKNLDIID